MAKKEDIYYVLELFHNNRPQKTFEELNKSEVGLFAVIKYLYEAKTEVTSAEICKNLKMSSARMAVLIKKLEGKGLVIKTNSTRDSRAKILKLSEKGISLANDLKEKMFEVMGKVIDEFGMAELEDFFEKMGRIKSIMEQNAPINLEEYDD